jgi:flagellar motor switch protein FliN/FliY
MANEPNGGITDADIDALLAEMNKTPGSSEPAPAPDPTAPDPTAAPDDQLAIDELLASSTFDDAAAHSAVETTAAAAADLSIPSIASGALPMDLPDLQRAMADAQVSSIDLLRDVELNVKIELGRSKMLVEEVLRLAEGSVVELDKLAGDPVDVFVNERLVARGEVLVLNDSFCVRVNEIVAGAAELG